MPCELLTQFFSHFCWGLCLVVSRVLALRCALLLSHLGLAEFSVDNGRADSEIRGLHGAKHSDYYRMYVRLTHSCVL